MNKIIRRLKIGIYSPYLRILGGGERYLLSIAESLSKQHEVFLFFHEDIREKAKSILNIALDRVHFLPEEIIRTKNLFKKYFSLLNFNIFFYMTDGSLFFPVARKNLLVIQSPVHIPRLSLMNKLKLVNWDVLCYSQFMKKIISKKLHREANLLSPCISGDRFKSDFVDKENIILTVGRFFPYPHSKKHDLLIDVFKKNYKKYFERWKLIIVGGLTEEGGEEIINDLKRKSAGFPIEILVNIPFSQLIKIYRSSKLYWHAAGFSEDMQIRPERAEHFGITTLEAMAAGVVPIVYDAGGQKDIVANGQNGFLWKTKEELVSRTVQLINNYELLQRLSRGVETSAQKYSCIKFYEKLDKLIT